MKAILTSLFVVSVIISSCVDQPKKALLPNPENATAQNDTLLQDSSKYTSIQWDNPEQNIGELTLGAKAQIKYSFKNTGSNPLYIINVQPGCGCTVAEYPKEAIAPGETGVVVAGFDTNGQHEGTFNKFINVTANTKDGKDHNLTFTGEIKKK